MIMNDIVNDKKGHNFVNDKTYWFIGILWYNIFSFSVRNIIWSHICSFILLFSLQQEVSPFLISFDHWNLKR